GQLIKDLLAYLPALGKDGKLGPLKVLNFIRKNIKEMDENMMNYADEQEAKGTPVIADVARDIHWYVYNIGFTRAMAEAPFISNSTDKPLAIGKFAATSEVINWRTKLDAKLRACKPTDAKDVTTGAAEWKAETDQVVAVLDDLIPKLHQLGSEYWAKQHERMRSFIVNGIPKINAKVAAVVDPNLKAEVYHQLVLNLHLLNTVASSRPPQ
ncbi:unnamed protein product, partial [Medioppia subpectinata]